MFVPLCFSPADPTVAALFAAVTQQRDRLEQGLEDNRAQLPTLAAWLGLKCPAAPM